MINAESGQMKVTTRPAERSSVVLEVEFPPERVQRSVGESVRHLARRTKVPGFRPGKVPRAMLERALGIRRDDPTAPNPLYDDAKEHLFEHSVIEALAEHRAGRAVHPGARMADVPARDRGRSYRVTLPLRPQVKLGAYTDYPFGITIDDHRRRRCRQGHRAAARPAGLAGAGRGPRRRDRRLRRDPLHRARDGAPIEGAQSERMPLILGRERFVPGFEEQLIGLREGDEQDVQRDVPGGLSRGGAGRQAGRVRGDAARAAREANAGRRTTTSRARLGTYADLAALRDEIKRRLERNALDRARHVFSDRIIEFAVANATLELPDLLIERELEVMLDELRVRLAEQGIGYEEYLRATERDEAKILDRVPARRRAARQDAARAVARSPQHENIEVTDEELDGRARSARASATRTTRAWSLTWNRPAASAYTRSLLRRVEDGRDAGRSVDRPTSRVQERAASA